jgi:hypothetical protein
MNILLYSYKRFNPHRFPFRTGATPARLGQGARGQAALGPVMRPRRGSRLGSDHSVRPAADELVARLDRRLCRGVRRRRRNERGRPQRRTASASSVVRSTIISPRHPARKGTPGTSVTRRRHRALRTAEYVPPSKPAPIARATFTRRRDRSSRGPAEWIRVAESRERLPHVGVGVLEVDGGRRELRPSLRRWVPHSGAPPSLSSCPAECGRHIYPPPAACDSPEPCGKILIARSAAPIPALTPYTT